MLDCIYDALRESTLTKRVGRVVATSGLTVVVDALDAFVGEQCSIRINHNTSELPAEVVGLADNRVILMPFGEMRGIRVGDEVVAYGHPYSVPVGRPLLGRIIDAFGNPLDGKPRVYTHDYYPLYGAVTNPLTRPMITEVLQTGVRAIDGLLTLGRGQRVGIFAGSGVGKSTLLGMLARNVDSDVNVVALIGERGREVREFVEQILGEEGLKKSVVLVATSDESALVRTHTAYAATAIAEYFRDQGLSVVLTMDSLTRFAMAQREIGLAVGDPPTTRGYTPSVFAMLARLLERAGTHESGGAISGIYTVLVEADDMNDPVGDSVRAVLDGHFVLSRDLANQGHFPALDILQSNSRLSRALLARERNDSRMRVIKMLNTYERARDMVELGIYKQGTSKDIDAAIAIRPQMTEFLCQATHENVSLVDGARAMDRLLKSVVAG